MVRLEKAGVDVVPRLISWVLNGTGSAGVNSYTFSAGNDA